MLANLIDTLLSTLKDVFPIAMVLFGFQLLVIRKAIPNLKSVIIGFIYVIVGLTFFLVGLEKALFPLGRLMADQLTNPAFIYGEGISVPDVVNWTDYYWVYIFAFTLGFSTAIAEPSLMAVAIKANEVSGGSIGVWGLRIAVALGSAIGVALGTYRIVSGLPIHYFIVTAYVLVVIQTIYTPRLMIPLAYDTGGVTTSTVTVPLVAALGLGLAETVPGRNPLLDGFGLIAFACLFPIMTVMAYAQLSDFKNRREKLKEKQKLKQKDDAFNKLT